MRIHLSVVRPAPFGDGTLTRSLCGRLNAACRDGMNLTHKPEEVTCKFCLSHPRFPAKFPR